MQINSLTANLSADPSTARPYRLGGNGLCNFFCEDGPGARNAPEPLFRSILLLLVFSAFVMLAQEFAVSVKFLKISAVRRSALETFTSLARRLPRVVFLPKLLRRLTSVVERPAARTLDRR